jgi:hypothetical protein
VRGTDLAAYRYDLISPIGLKRLAATYGEGAVKYPPGNWMKGIPASDLINHAMTHIMQWLAGDTSEDHLAHATWNLFSVMHFEQTRPDLIDCVSRVKLLEAQKRIIVALQQTDPKRSEGRAPRSKRGRATGGKRNARAKRPVIRIGIKRGDVAKLGRSLNAARRNFRSAAKSAAREVAKSLVQ